MFECKSFILLGGELIYAFNHSLPSLVDVAPHLGAREALVLFISEPIKANPQQQPRCSLNLANQYLNMI